MRPATRTDVLIYAVTIVLCLILAVAWATVGELVYAGVNGALAVLLTAFTCAHVLQ